MSTRVFAAFAIAAAGAVPLSGCSPGADYPSLFPAVHDMPPPRSDTTLDPAQIQQATEDLITARDHLNAEAPASSQDKTDKAAAKKNVPPKKSAGSGKDAAAARSTQTAGADTKP